MNVRCAEGPVAWLTGRPATGKTTIAEASIARLRARGHDVLWLDSDDLRTVLTPNPTYSDSEREWFYGVIAHLAARASEGGVMVIISATAPRREYRDRARRAVSRFIEVHLDCDEATLRARDPKHLYRRSASGEVKNLPGVDGVYEPPLAPELTFDSSKMSIPQMAAALCERIEPPEDCTPTRYCSMSWDRSK